MNKGRIAIIYSNRAEKSILDPLVDALKTQELNPIYHDLSKNIDIEDDKNLSRAYDHIFNFVEEENIEQAVLCGDRREMLFVSLALFLKNVPFSQLAAGDLSESLATVDDYFRHMITLISQKQVCFSQLSYQNTKDHLGKLNIKLNASVLPLSPSLWEAKPSVREIEGEYDLVLMHPQSLSRKKTQEDQQEVSLLIEESLQDNQKTVVIIKGNKDKNYDIFYDYWDRLECNKPTTCPYTGNWGKQTGGLQIYENTKKEKFFSLIKYCSRFITNSSCSFYEAPSFLTEDQIIRIGGRNHVREIVKADLNKKIDSRDILSSVLYKTPIK